VFSQSLTQSNHANAIPSHRLMQQQSSCIGRATTAPAHSTPQLHSVYVTHASVLSYFTCGGGLERCSSRMSFTHFSIFAGFLSACSMERTATSPYCSFFDFARSCSSSTVGSDWLADGSSRKRRPRPSSLPSGRGTYTRLNERNQRMCRNICTSLLAQRVNSNTERRNQGTARPDGTMLAT
jgi:hypothetical protein